MKNYKCGHCKGENVTLERQDGTTIGEHDYSNTVVFQFHCPDCKFTLKIPVPTDYVNSQQFNPELELGDLWKLQSKKAIKLT